MLSTNSEALLYAGLFKHPVTFSFFCLDVLLQTCFQAQSVSVLPFMEQAKFRIRTKESVARGSVVG
jgi:hypothetical protein